VKRLLPNNFYDTSQRKFCRRCKGNRVGVFLPIKDYNKLLEELEELDDIKAYDKAVSRKQEFIPLNLALKQIEASRKKKK
jgi:hypothetical protein